MIGAAPAQVLGSRIWICICFVVALSIGEAIWSPRVRLTLLLLLLPLPLMSLRRGSCMSTQ